MSKYGNEKKNEQLGMPFGTASGRLRKLILFALLKETNKNICFQCKKEILSIEELSIEHIVPWIDSENPKELFFSMDNISFSHLSCNVGAVRKEYLHESGKKVSKLNIIPCPEGKAHCHRCKEFKPLSEFNNYKSHYNGVDSECKQCRAKRRKNSKKLGR